MGDHIFRVFTTINVHEIAAPTPSAARDEVRRMEPLALITKVKRVDAGVPKEKDHG